LTGVARTQEAGLQPLASNDPHAMTMSPGRPEPGVAARVDAVAPKPPDRDAPSPVPEPGALFLVGTGMLAVAITASLRRRRAEAAR
jgi:hypothetical protein